MKYTKEYVANLDEKTLDFCKRWIWDALRRSQIGGTNLKTKAQREYNQAYNHGLESAFDLIRQLKRYNKGGNIANEFSLLDEDIKPDEIKL